MVNWKPQSISAHKDRVPQREPTLRQVLLGVRSTGTRDRVPQREPTLRQDILGGKVLVQDHEIYCDVMV